MNRTRAGGLALLSGGLLGYALGIAVAYPGRELSVAAVMVGLTLTAVGGEPE